jgi:branched-chain amino acid transport system ATP-binding protein
VEGLAPVIVNEITQQIRHLKTLGLSILFAEQNIQFAVEISDRGYILEGGQVRYEGTISDLEEKPEIKQKYLMI